MLLCSFVQFRPTACEVILALTTGNPVYLISTKAHGRCDRSAEDAYASAAPDPTFACVGGPCCPALDFVIAFWIMITFYTLLTSLFCIHIMYEMSDHFLNFHVFQKGARHLYFSQESGNNKINQFSFYSMFVTSANKCWNKYWSNNTFIMLHTCITENNFIKLKMLNMYTLFSANDKITSNSINIHLTLHLMVILWFSQ
jgi:hypothetical protein